MNKKGKSLGKILGIYLGVGIGFSALLYAALLFGDYTDPVYLATVVITFIAGLVIIIIGVFLYHFITQRKKKAPINIFISHAVADFETYHINQMSKYLGRVKSVNHGFICEEDLKANIDDWMDETVPLCQMLLFIATQRSFNSRDCGRELRLCAKHDLFLVPIRGNDITWDELKRKGMHPEMGFEVDNTSFGTLMKNISAYVRNYDKTINRITKALRSSNIIDVSSLASKLNTNYAEIRKYLKILIRNDIEFGVFSVDNKKIFNAKEVLKRVGSIKGLSDKYISEILKNADISSNNQSEVEIILEKFVFNKKQKNKRGTMINDSVMDDLLCPSCNTIAYRTDTLFCYNCGTRLR